MLQKHGAGGLYPMQKTELAGTLELLAQDNSLEFITCSGAMGEEALNEAGIGAFKVIYVFNGESSARDTVRAAQIFQKAGVDLILFCGGDGTARDIFDAVGRDVPILGIPAGVKMYSAVFAIDPPTAAELVKGFDMKSLRDSEVMDVDEDAYRAGELKTRLHGIARTTIACRKSPAIQAGL